MFIVRKQCASFLKLSLCWLRIMSHLPCLLLTHHTPQSLRILCSLPLYFAYAAPSAWNVFPLPSSAAKMQMSFWLSSDVTFPGSPLPAFLQLAFLSACLLFHSTCVAQILGLLIHSYQSQLMMPSWMTRAVFHSSWCPKGAAAPLSHLKQVSKGVMFVCNALVLLSVLSSISA